MSIQDWPRSGRSREKLIQQDVGSLSNAELLALILQTGHPGHSAVDVAYVNSPDTGITRYSYDLADNRIELVNLQFIYVCLISKLYNYS